MKKPSNLSSSAKRYLLNLGAAIIILVLTSIFFVTHENMLCGFVQMILWFNLTHYLIMMVIVGIDSRYNRERNMVIAIIPAFMSTVGCLLAFWLYVEVYSESLGAGDVILALAVAIVMPITTTFLDRTVGIKAWAMYLISLGQMIVAGLIIAIEIFYFS